MDYITIIIGSLTAISVVGLAWLGGYELGQANGIGAERELADRRINGVLESVNSRRPKAAKNRRKAARKVVRS
jgi:hypothetical protein